MPNSGAERLREYSPFPDVRHGGGGGDAYLAFIERTLKPLVDRRVRTPAGTRGDRHLRLVDGRPDQPLLVLPRAGDVRVRRRDEPVAVVRRARDHRLHREGRPAARPPLRGYRHRRRRVDTLRRRTCIWRTVLERKGYVPGESMRFAAVEGGRHEEAHWAERLVPALEFLLRRCPRRRGGVEPGAAGGHAQAFKWRFTPALCVALRRLATRLARQPAGSSASMSSTSSGLARC